jgi:YVTN family beta-propeller protein
MVTPDNSLLYVTNFGSNSVAVYSIDTGKRMTSVAVGSHPESMAISPNQLMLLVVNTASGDLSVLSLIDRKGHQQPETPVMETMIPLGRDPRAIVVKAFISQRQ